MSTPSDTAITILKRQLALLEQLLALPRDCTPPPGVSFEDHARQVLGQTQTG